MTLLPRGRRQSRRRRRRLREQVGELPDVRTDLGATVVPAGDEMVQRARNDVRAERRPNVLAEVGRAFKLVADPADRRAPESPSEAGVTENPAKRPARSPPKKSPATLATNASEEAANRRPVDNPAHR